MANTILTATNTWGDGLVMDLAPDNTQNNCLTSALNATLITYNGNEFSLQNDMGNGRVETAYLPEGYIPVGSCELGGIIYIASYNPLTNKSQIGSFPSPERNISSEEMGNSIISFENGEFGYKKDEEDDYYYLIPVIKKKLTQKKLNPGDYFIVCGNINVNGDCLYDYPITRLGKIFDSSGKTIMDEYNNFISDGTKKIQSQNKRGPINLYLASIDSTNKLHKLENLTLKDNKYHIAENENDAYGDIDIDKYRELVDNDYYDVYQEKSSGDLYVIAEVVTINKFGANLDYIYEENKWKATVKISQSSDYEDIRANCYYIQFNNGNIYKYSTEDLEEPFEIQDGIYKITPAMTIKEKDYLMDWLSVSINVDTSLLGKGIAKINEWRYYHNPDNLSLRLGIQTYPKPNYNVNKIELLFFDFNKLLTENSNEIEKVFNKLLDENSDNTQKYNFKLEYNSLESVNSHETIQYNTYYSTSNYSKQLNPYKLYLVKFKITYKKGNNSYSNYLYRWLYTCPVFNQEYLDSVLDFDKLQPKLELYVDVKDSVVDYTYEHNYILPTIMAFDEVSPNKEWISKNTTAKDTKTSVYDIQLQAEVKLKNNYEYFNIDNEKCSFNWNVIKHTPELNPNPEISILQEKEVDGWLAPDILKHEGTYIKSGFKDLNTAEQTLKETSNINNPILRVETKDTLKIYGTVVPKDIDLDILKPLVHDENSALEYNLSIGTESNYIKKINNQFPMFSLTNGNYLYRTIVRFDETDSNIKYEGLENKESNFYYLTLFDNTDFQQSIKEVVEKSSGQFTIIPILYGLITGDSDDRQVGFIRTTYEEQYQINNIAKDNTYWRAHNDSSINQGENNYFYIISDCSNIQSSDHESNYPDVWFYCMRDVNDEIIPLNCFTYKNHEQDTDDQEIYSSYGSSSWVMQPFLNLLTQLYKRTERTTVSKQVVSYLSFPKEYEVEWQTKLDCEVTLGSEYINTINIEGENYKDIINLYNIKPNISPEIQKSKQLVTSYIQRVYNKMDNNILLDKYKSQMKSISYSKLLPLKYGFVNDIIQNGSSEENVLYYIGDLYSDDNSKKSGIIKQLDKNFVLYPMDHPGAYYNTEIFTAEYNTLNNGITNLGQYLTLDSNGLLRLNSKASNSENNLHIQFGGNNPTGPTRTTLLLNRNLKLNNLFSV